MLLFVSRLRGVPFLSPVTTTLISASPLKLANDFFIFTSFEATILKPSTPISAYGLPLYTLSLPILILTLLIFILNLSLSDERSAPISLLGRVFDTDAVTKCVSPSLIAVPSMKFVLTEAVI